MSASSVEAKDTGRIRGTCQLRNPKTHITSATRRANSRAEAGTPVARAVQVIRDMGSACPYKALGKKAMNAVKGNRQTVCEPGSDRVGNLQAMVKMGRNIALIGFFCPIFWLSLISGVRGPQLKFNAIHSGVVVLIGIALMLRGKIGLKRAQRGN